MLIILPPSETKADGGCGAPLRLSALSFGGLSPTRRHLLDAVGHLAEEFRAAQASGKEERMAEVDKLIGIRATQREHHAANLELLTSPTLPAIERYTGVTFDAVDADGARTGVSLDAQARSRLAIGSALFGVVAAEDPIPRYRLSAGSKVVVDGAARTLRSQWTKPLAGESIAEELSIWREDQSADSGGIIDLRSGAYRDLGPIPGAVSLRVETEYADGRRKVVSHFNKHYKGLVARELARADLQLPSDAEGSGELAEAFAGAIGQVQSFVDAGFTTELRSPQEVTLVVPEG